MKKVYIVLENSIDSQEIKGIYSARVKAEKAILKFRDELIEGWKNVALSLKQDLKTDKNSESIQKYMLKFHKDCEQREWLEAEIKYYEEKIKNLSSNDYKKWDNELDECLYIQEYELK